MLRPVAVIGNLNRFDELNYFVSSQAAKISIYSLPYQEESFEILGLASQAQPIGYEMVVELQDGLLVLFT